MSDLGTDNLLNTRDLNHIRLHNTLKLILGSILLALPLVGIGQVTSPNRPAIAIGLKLSAQAAGIANQNNYGQNEMDYQANYSYGGGVTAAWHYSRKNSLFLEASIQQGGQEYEDNFKHSAFKKVVRYNLLSFPVALRHVLSKAGSGYGGVGSEVKPLWYLVGGVQINHLLSPEVDWYVNQIEVDFFEFVLEGGNPNQAILEAMGAPASDEELYVKWDILFIAGGGFRIHPNSVMSVSLEVRGGIGLTDINTKDWRLENNRGVYGASRNTFLGLHAGVHFLLSPIQ